MPVGRASSATLDARLPAHAPDRDARRRRAAGGTGRVRVARAARARRSACVWLVLVAVAAFRPTLLTSGDPLAVDGSARLQSPSWAHLFGTDQLGRDLYTRVVHGAALSMQAALARRGRRARRRRRASGSSAGFARGWVDDAVMRLVDVVLAIPGLLLALALITVLGFGTYNVALAVGLASIAACARVMRSEVLRVRQSPFVEAAGANGARWSSVLLRHVLPNSLGPVARARRPGVRHRDPRHLVAQLPRLRRPAADAGVGLARGHRPRLPARGLVADDDARPHRRRDRARRQPHRPRPRRRTGDARDAPTPLLEVSDLRVRYRLRARHGRRRRRRRPRRWRRARCWRSSASPARASRRPPTPSPACCRAPPSVIGGAVRFDGQRPDARSASAGCGPIRGRQIGVIPQDPTVSLNPVTAHRRPGRRGAARSTASPTAATPPSPPSRRSTGPASPTRRRGPASTRTSCRAGCASAC